MYIIFNLNNSKLLHGHLLMKNIVYIAHRGASGHEPENTLRSVAKAIQMGATWIEVDVFLVEDQLMVIHDKTLDRTTSGKGPISVQTIEYLRTLDAGKGEKIPFLSEILDVLEPDTRIIIELKGPHTAAPTVSLITRYVDVNNFTYDRFLCSSFDIDELMTVRKLNPDINISPVFRELPSDYKDVARQLNAASIHVKHKIVNKQIVDDIHKNGLKIFIYTVNTKEDIYQMKELGVDGVFTNFPELMR